MIGRPVVPFTLHTLRGLRWTKLVTTTTRDTFKATSVLNVSCHLIHAPSIRGQTHLLDLMHPCLNVDEIVRLIAHELVTSRGRPSAVRLACCCKSFEDPVLDTLWKTHDSPLPLLELFLGHVWDEREHTVSVPTTNVFFLSLTI
jgi:hypothetical protein